MKKLLVISIFLKGWSGTKKFSLSALLTPFPLTPFTIKQIIGCTTEVAKGTNKVLENTLFGFFILCLHNSVPHQLIYRNPLIIL